MIFLRSVGFLGLAACLSLPLTAQQAAPPTDSSSQSPSDQAAPFQTDQARPAEQPSSDETKKESKLKRKAKEAAPSCIGFSGGAGKCRHSKEDEEEQKKEAADRQLRQHCNDQVDTSPKAPRADNDQPCTDLHKRDAGHDLEVGDTYLEQKNYNAAAMRYRDALQNDPGNALAMLHLAQALENAGRRSEAYEQYQNFLNTDPQGPNAKRAREALDRLRPYWTGGSASK